MSANRGAVDVVVPTLRHGLGESDGDALPNTRGAPSPETSIDRIPIAIFLRNITPWRAGAMQNCAERFGKPGNANGLGKISYSVYLLHDLVIGVLLRLVALGLFSRIENPAIRSPLLVLIGFSVLFPISALSYRFLEAPCNRFAVWLIGQIRNRRAQATMASLQIFQLQDKINSGPGLKIEKIEN
jgi:hypothetical protein